MEKIHQKRAGKSGTLPRKTSLPPSAEQVRADDVERVLEHVSSPFRWELLEVPPAQPKILLPKKPTNQKSRGK